MPKPAVVVVNSHVARGSVGGRASVFALERMGFPVWSVPTVLLPWHPGHGRATRIAPDNVAFETMIGDLAGSSSLGEVGAVLSGYFGAADQVADVADLVTAVKARNPGALFLCDPIAGDSGGLFQPETIVTALRRQLMPLADIVTPNRHELGWLTGMPVGENATIVAAVRAVGPKEVVVTSAFGAPGEIGTILVAGDGVWLATHRKLNDVPHGTGDLFAALYIGHRLDGLEAAAALERAASSVLRLIEIAIASRADEMPLAEGQDAFFDAQAGVTVAKLD